MKKDKIPVPLKRGALLVRRTVTLGTVAGVTHEAKIEIRYDGPNQPTPESGAQWPPEHDWPAVERTLTLPTNIQEGQDSRYIHPDLRNERIKLCGQCLNAYWGRYYKSAPYTTDRRSGASLRKLCADMLREVVAELRPVQEHLRAREARLRQREATLLAGQDMKPIKEGQ